MSDFFLSVSISKKPLEERYKGSFYFLKDFIYLFLEREGRERNIYVWLPLMCPLLGTWPAAQAGALTGNQTSDPLVCRLLLSPLSHTSQGI